MRPSADLPTDQVPENLPQAGRMRSVSGSHRMLGIGILTAIVLAGGCGLLLLRHTPHPVRPATHQRASSAPSPTPTEQANIPASPTPLLGGTLFASVHLGISFSFGSSQGGDTIATKEVGDTVYVYDTRYDYRTGQKVQVIAKPSSDSLPQALTDIILKGYNPANCLIGPAYSDSLATSQSSAYVTASIRWADTNLHGNFIPDDASKCPGQYLAINSSRYFLMWSCPGLVDTRSLGRPGS